MKPSKTSPQLKLISKKAKRKSKTRILKMNNLFSALNNKRKSFKPFLKIASAKNKIITRKRMNLSVLVKEMTTSAKVSTT